MMSDGNESFIAEPEKPEHPPWLLGWFVGYLFTIWALLILGSVAVKVIDF